MRTTIDLPDELFRRVKAAAALKGVSLKEFFTLAVREVLENERDSEEYGQHRPVPVTIQAKGRKIQSFTNAELDEVFMREDMEKWDSK